jgi:tRNA (mo5U34)-methyltransferase
MAPLTLRSGPVSVTLDLPAKVLKALRRIPASAGTAGGRHLSAAPSRLEVSNRKPVLHTEPRSVAASAAYFREIHEMNLAKAASATSDDLRGRVSSAWWYHTIELPGGVTTPGAYDHRELVPHYGLPADLRGQTVLDIATFDGFWAFEFERRGGQVTATDIPRIRDLDLPPPVRAQLVADGLDWETGKAFNIAHEALQSTVKRVEVSVYDLNPETMGTFDFVHVADLLLHLENPIAALRAIRSVTKHRAIIADCFDPNLSHGAVGYLGGWSVATWWSPGLDGLAQMVIDAGFKTVEVACTYRLGTTDSKGPWRASLLATA